MNLKKVLILSIAGLVLWSAWGSRVNMGEGTEGVTGGASKQNAEEIPGKYPDKTVEDRAEISEETIADNAGILNMISNKIELYISARELWVPEDGSSFYYAWYDIDGDGPPELVVFKQADEEDGYEMHFYIIDERNEIQELKRLDNVEIQSDSLPTVNVYQDYSSGRHRYVFSTQSSNSLSAAAQWEIMTAEKLTWKNFGTRAGHISDEALLEELKTSYAAYRSSMAGRDVYVITNRLQSAQEHSEEENAFAVRRFAEKVKQGEPAWEIFTRYTKEDHPIPVYVDYDGEDFYGIWDESATPYAVSECPYHGFRYQYMKTFLTPGEDGCVHRTIILTNKEDLSLRDLDGNYGEAGEYPEYLILYGDLETEDPLCRATDIEETAKGDFAKRNGVYLIEDGKQLELLSKMVAEGKEIEPGVDAASAFYRLCNDMEMKDFFWIGSMKSPFYGSFLGDGYVITGVYFNIHWGGGYSRNDHVRYNFNNWIKAGIRCTIENEETLEEVREKLMTVPSESIRINIKTEGLDVQSIAESAQKCWNRNHYGNHYFVQIDNLNFKEGSDYEWAQDSDALLPFLDLFGEEAGEIMRQTAEEEDSYVSFLRLERIDGLDICSFAVRASEKEQYHVMVQGEWEDTEVPFQHLVIPSTGHNKYDSLFYGEFDGYSIMQADINFDGRQDLLIEEGDHGGTGGSFMDYRVAAWDEKKGEFAWYPSFPDMASDLKLNEERVIKSYRIGASYEAVCEYGIVNGEYVETRELIREDHWETKTSTLSYYKMGVLVKVHDTTNMSADEFEALYPDLNFWSRG